MSKDADQKPGCLAPFLSLFRRAAAPQEPGPLPCPTGNGVTGARQEPVPLPYRTRDDFLSFAELSFYHILELVAGDRAAICVKVGLGEILYVAKPNANLAYFNRIMQKHVDFLLCEPKSMRPLIAIELDDSSHRRPDRQRRDEFVDEAFKAADLPLVHVSVRTGYNVTEIAAQLAPYLGVNGNAPAGTGAAGLQGAPDQDASPVCPKCGIPMVLQTAKQGRHAGEQFYGCANFPKCREILPVAA